MSTAVLSPRLELTSLADKSLKAAAGFWLLVAVVGQWAFFYYIAVFYGSTALHGNIQAWTKNTLVQRSYIPGDTAGNLVFGAHALLAGVIAFGGAIQLIPQVRRHALAVHRWNGRVFGMTALGVSLSGLYMEWVRSGLYMELVRGHFGKVAGGVAISLDAVLIVVFVALAWRSAVAHEVSTHRRWALRAYLVANGQWFFRVGFMAWVIVNGGPVGVGKNFDGPFVQLWGYGCYLLPLVILELYLRTKDSAGPRWRFAMAGALSAVTVLMAVGILGFANFMWWPLLKAMR